RAEVNVRSAGVVVEYDPIAEDIVACLWIQSFEQLRFSLGRPEHRNNVDRGLLRLGLVDRLLKRERGGRSPGSPSEAVRLAAIDRGEKSRCGQADRQQGGSEVCLRGECWFRVAYHRILSGNDGPSRSDRGK